MDIDMNSLIGCKGYMLCVHVGKIARKAAVFAASEAATATQQIVKHIQLAVSRQLGNLIDEIAMVIRQGGEADWRFHKFLLSQDLWCVIW